MNRLTVSLVAALAAVWGLAWAQSANHQLAVTIPDYVGIRILGSGSGPRAVVFDFASEPTAYLEAITNGGIVAPTSVSRFDDIEVNVTHSGRWTVAVVATPLAYSGPGSGDGLTLGRIRVVRGSRSGLEQTAITGPGNSAWYWPAWLLSTTAQQIASRTGATGGWRSLGFNGWDYEVRVHGNEDPGSYATVVTYLLSAP